jgi:hypothetical protein
MKSKFLNLFFLILLSGLVTAQNVNLQFEKKIEDSFIENLFQSQRDYYVSENGERVIFISDRRLVIIDGSSGDILMQKEFKSKSNVKTSALSAAFGNTLNTSMEEGVAYHVDEVDNKMVLLDYNAGKNVVSVVDLVKAEELWSTDKYRYTTSLNKQIFDKLTDNALRLAPQLALGKINADDISLQDMGQSLLDNASNPGFSSPSAAAWIKYMSGRNVFVLVSNEGLICLDANTGEEKWRYTKGDLNVSFHDVVPGKPIWVALNYSASFLEAARRVAMAFDINTGDVISTMEFESDYKDNRASIIGDNLVLDFISLEVFDIPTGEKLLSTIKSKTIKMGNTMGASNAAGERNTLSYYLKSIIDGKFVYNSVGKLGKQNFPNDGSFKSEITKYNIENGDVVWASDKLPKGSTPLAKTENYLVVRVDKGSGNYQILTISDKDGSTIGESDKFDNYFEREGAGTQFSGDMAFLGAKKSVYLYDLEKSSVVESYDIAKTGLGKMAGLGVASDKLMLFADKGVRILKRDGTEINTLKTSRLNGGIWNDKLSLLYDDERFYVVDNNNGQITKELPYGMEKGDQIITTRNLETVVIISPDRTLRSFSLK